MRHNNFAVLTTNTTAKNTLRIMKKRRHICSTGGIPFLSRPWFWGKKEGCSERSIWVDYGPVWLGGAWIASRGVC